MGTVQWHERERYDAAMWPNLLWRIHNWYSIRVAIVPAWSTPSVQTCTTSFVTAVLLMLTLRGFCACTEADERGRDQCR